MTCSLNLGFVGLALCGMLPTAFGQTYTTFDPPGSIFTQALSINSLGDVTGTYEDSSGLFHGFLRTANGTITTFDPPGSTTTIPYGIDSSDEITGYAYVKLAYEGFLRTSDGTITIVNIPGTTQTVPTSINSSGDIAGYAYLTNGQLGFILTSGGALTTFDVGTLYSIYINDSDAVAGTTFGDVKRMAGFVKPNGGNITTFNVPQKLSASATGINSSGTVIGVASDVVCGLLACYGVITTQGFVRTSNGQITTFQVAKGSFTYSDAINTSGEIVGHYGTNDLNVHGFSRDTSGAITTFDPPESTSTLPTGINDSGTIAGYFLDNTYHGFILTP